MKNRIYYIIALVLALCSVGLFLYERDLENRMAHLNGVLYFQNTNLQSQVKELEVKVEELQQRVDAKRSY